MSSAYPTQISLDIALDEWAEGLANLSGSDVKRGLEVWQEAWPPSLPEFKKACKKPRQIASHQDFVFLPKPKPDKKLGARAFSDMKDRLRR